MEQRGSDAGGGIEGRPSGKAPGHKSRGRNGKSKSGGKGARVGRSAASLEEHTASAAGSESSEGAEGVAAKPEDAADVPGVSKELTQEELAAFAGGSAGEASGVDPEAQAAADQLFERLFAGIPQDKHEEFKRALRGSTKIAGPVPIQASPTAAASPAETPTDPRPTPAEPTPTRPEVPTPHAQPAQPAVPAPGPTHPATPQAAQAQAAKPKHTTPVLDLKKLGCKQKYVAKLPAGYTPENPGLLYSPLANVDLSNYEPRVLEGLAVDVVQWGGHSCIVFLPQTDVRCLLPDGTVFDNIESEDVERAPVMIPVDGDSSKLAEDLLNNPEEGIVAAFVPSFPQTIADGTQVVRHLIGRYQSIPKKGIWPRE